MRRSLLIFLLFLCPLTTTAQTEEDVAELAVYLRGEGAGTKVIVSTEKGYSREQNYRPDVILFDRLSPGRAQLSFGNESSMKYEIAIIANMRTVIVFEHVEGRFRMVGSPRLMPVTVGKVSATRDLIHTLPFQREATAPLNLLPGLIGTDAPNFHGATQRANRFLIDGIDATDPFDGTLELRLPFIALEQLSLRYDAPGSEGSTVSLMTTPMRKFDGRVGGEGSFFFETSDFPDEIEGQFFTRERELLDAEALFGWGTEDGDTRLLGAARYQSDDFREQPERFQPVETRVPVALLRFEKRLSDAWKLNAGWYASFTKKGKLFAPLTSEFDIRESDGDLVTADERHDVQLFNASVGHQGERTFANAFFSYYRGSLTSEPTSGNRSVSTLFDGIADPAILAAGSILAESRDDLRERLKFGASFGRDVHVLGEHRLSAQVSGEWSDIRIERAFNGGFRFDFSETLDRAFRRFSYEQNGDDSILDQRFVRRYQATLEDRWSIWRLAVDVGLTLDKTTGGNDVADVFDWSSLEPHVEAKFDLFGDGEIILRGGYHRSYFRLLGVQIPGNPYMQNVQFFDAGTGSWETSTLNRVEQFGYSADGVDADIERPYADIVNLGADIVLGERSVLSGSWTWRRELDLIEDIETNLWPNYTTEQFEDELDRTYRYFVRNPGLDDTVLPTFFLTNPEDLEREYYGVDLLLSTQPDDNTSLWVAYTWSRTEGGIDNTLEESTGDSRALNDPNERINAEGFLSSDNRHLLRLTLIWHGPYGIDVGGLLRYDSGRPLNRLRLNPEVGRFEILADPRGSVYRADATTTIDLRVSREIHLGERLSGRIVFDLFNFTDDETPTAYIVDDERFGLPSTRREPRRWRLGIQFRF